MNAKSIFSVCCALCACVALAEGPRVSILGDSYSTFEGTSPEGYAIYYHKNPGEVRFGVDSPEKTWWGQTIKALGGTLEKNDAWSGSTICTTGYGGANVPESAFVSRVDRLGDPDLILICGGTNDSWANSPIGEFKYADWTPEDLKTFRPAVAKMFADIARLYPKAKPLFILNDILKPEINSSVYEICAHYGVPCLTLRDIAREAGHPTALGMTAMAAQVSAVAKFVLDPENKENPVNRIDAFLSEAGAFFLATADGDQPKLRPLGAHHVVDGKLLFGVGEFKNVYKQLAANPRTEIVALRASDNHWLRYTGRVVFEKEDDRARHEETFLAAAPGLRAVYDKTPGKKMMIFHLEDASAEIIPMMPPGEKVL